MNATPSSRTRFYRSAIPALVWAALIFVASSIPSNDLPATPIFDYDKLIHMSIYFVFAALMYRAFRFEGASPAVQSRAALLTIGIIALYGASDEFHQHFVPGRSMDVFDWIADLAGGILCVAVLSYLSPRIQKKHVSPGP